MKRPHDHAAIAASLRAPHDPRAMLITWLTSRVEHEESKIKEWSASLVARPDNLTFNSDSAFTSAQWLQIGRDILQSLTATGSKATVESAREYARRKAMDVARYPKSSTSATANLAHRVSGEVWCEIVEFCEGVIRGAGVPEKIGEVTP